jgi:ketosteroid isomerase-like protein
MMTTVNPERPLDVVTRIYAAFAEKDLDAIVALTSPDIVVTQDPALPWGGRYEGHEGLGRFSMALLGAIESEVTVHEIYEAGDNVVQYGRTAGIVLSTGRHFDVPECHVWTVIDGKAVEARYFIDSSAMLDALASG